MTRVTAEQLAARYVSLYVKRTGDISDVEFDRLKNRRRREMARIFEPRLSEQARRRREAAKAANQNENLLKS